MASATAAPENQEFDELYVSPKCFVQTAESRVSSTRRLDTCRGIRCGREATWLTCPCVAQFGSHVLDELQAFVLETQADNELVFDDDDEDPEEEEEEENLLVPEGGLIDLYEIDFIASAGLETDPNHAQHGFPRIATTRNNLTALSQKYNVWSPKPGRGA